VKILVIQFRYLGDTVLMTPALKALKQALPESQLHVLVAEEVVPVLRHFPGLDRLWAFPRRRGRAGLKQSWPVIRALRRERFDRSVDLGGNDRGAIVSLACGARQRLGALRRNGFLGRRFCYTQVVRPPGGEHEALANLRLLAPWGVAAPDRPVLELEADPALAPAAEELLPGPALLCHVASSQPNREWPISRWAELFRLAAGAGLELVFSTGLGPREQARLTDLTALAPAARTLPPLPDLAMFMAVVKRAGLFISGDTGPLHLAAGLGVPTISLFGPSSPRQWAPLGENHHFLQVAACTCGPATARCLAPSPCMNTISPAAVLELIRRFQNGRGTSPSQETRKSAIRAAGSGSEQCHSGLPP
jgi:ADP-heptose:LPS heptosyltransferase